MNSVVKITRSGRGRGKISGNLLPDPVPEPGNASPSNQQTPVIPKPASPVPVRATGESKRGTDKDMKQPNKINPQNTFNGAPEGLQVLEERDRIARGMGMRDVDRDYLSLLDRNMNNINDPENEWW